MDDEAPIGEETEPVGTTTVLVVIVATMIGFATVITVVAVGVLDAEMPQLPEIRDDGTDGGGIPNIDGIPTGDANASDDDQERSDDAGNATEPDRP